MPSTEKSIRNKALVFGDNVDTDVIIPARYCTASTESHLAPYAMIDIDPSFSERVQREGGAILVAGKNFGCGSSRETAPMALKGAGVTCVIAASFARIFYRNAINIGLPILECAEAVVDINEGDKLQIRLDTGEIHNFTQNRSWRAVAFPPEIQAIIDAGGLASYTSARLAQRRKTTNKELAQ